MAFRLDKGTYRKPKKTPAGHLRADALITRTGVFQYPDAGYPGGVRREYRPLEEVSKPESLASFSMVPVTDDHPAGAVTAANADKIRSVGHLGEDVRMDGDHVAAPMLILTDAMVKKIEAGKVQLSCGYSCDLDETPGVTPEGERYDAIQRNIVGNHVAIVDVGRAGPTARIRMDGALSMIDPSDEENPMEEMQKLLAQALKSAADERARADAAEAKLKLETARADAAEGARDAATKRADAAEKERADVDVAAMVTARVKLVTDAQPVLGTETRLDAMTDRAIKVAVIEKIDGDKVPAERSDAYVDGAYDGVIKRARAAAASHGSARAAINGARADAAAGEDIEAKARAAALERDRNAWKPTTRA